MSGWGGWTGGHMEGYTGGWMDGWVGTGAWTGGRTGMYLYGWRSIQHAWEGNRHTHRIAHASMQASLHYGGATHDR